MSTKCTACRKKTGILGFECRCGSVFCVAHRHPEDHQCTVDYKLQERLKLSKENPLIAAPKVPKF